MLGRIGRTGYDAGDGDGNAPAGRRRPESEMIRTGCDILASENCARLSGLRTGLLSNPASVDGGLRHVIDIVGGSYARLSCLFGPQHGLKGDTQANMIEWRGYTHPRLGIPVHSLYGDSREPDAAVLEKLDAVVIDLPDIGARPYTYLWTAALMMRACAATGTKVVVLDRPCPIGGSRVEGSILDMAYASFVGLHPLPMRHGLTIGEALRLINGSGAARCELEIIEMEGWARGMYFGETGLPWVLPSPNIPTPETALVYPGMVLLEATNVSEGRGTTRPFEIMGAPWIDPEALAGRLAARCGGGAIFRPLDFRPAFDKYAGELCGGVQIHVTDRDSFNPVRCAALALGEIAVMYPGHFEWLPPPYEYERKLMPVDILSGDSSLRETIGRGEGVEGLFARWLDDERRFEREREPWLFY
jgi:uncharacterized protein YbbC (DUF1343 family)